MFVFKKFSECNPPFCTGSGSHITRFHTARHFLRTYLLCYRTVTCSSLDKSNSSNCAFSARVFMIRSLGSQNQDVAHILPVKSLNAEVLYSFIKGIILKLEVVGFQVLGVVFGNNAINGIAIILVNPQR